MVCRAKEKVEAEEEDGGERVKRKRGRERGERDHASDHDDYFSASVGECRRNVPLRETRPLGRRPEKANESEERGEERQLME
jgi:hypothetical protein